MISVETINPVYSNAGGKTPEEKAKNRAKAFDKAKQVYGKAKETGLLQGLENLALQQGKDAGTGGSDMPPPPPPPPAKEPMSKTLKIGLIVGGVAVVGFAVYWFAIRKK
jgi:hypothetical protein